MSTKGPMWGHPVPVLGAISPFLEPFLGRLSPNIDNVTEKLTLRYPHEGPWVERGRPRLAHLQSHSHPRALWNVTSHSGTFQTSEAVGWGGTCSG